MVRYPLYIGLFFSLSTFSSLDLHLWQKPSTNRLVRDNNTKHTTTIIHKTFYTTLHNINPAEVAMSTAARFKLIFYVPPSSLAVCKAAIFAAGAGRYPGKGNYTECCWTTLGTGQFRPGDAAKPNIGTVGELEEIQEARVETLCLGEDLVKRAVEALKG